MTNGIKGSAGNESFDEHEYDIFRDSCLRYLGYANEVGESFRYQFPKFVAPTYFVAFGYCLADAVTSGYSTFSSAKIKDETSDKAVVDSAISTVDTLIWQTLASVILPGAAINTIVRASRFTVARSPLALPIVISKWLPTAMGLGSIPLIISPIDKSVDFFMDSTFRSILKRKRF